MVPEKKIQSRHISQPTQNTWVAMTAVTMIVPHIHLFINT